MAPSPPSARSRTHQAFKRTFSRNTVVTSFTFDNECDQPPKDYDSSKGYRSMRLRLAKIDEFQFLTCLEYQVWGSDRARFKDWRVGDYLAFIVDKAVAGLAQVSGESFFSDQLVWVNHLYPYRIPIKFIQVMLPEHRPPVSGKIRGTITSELGSQYSWLIITQRPILGNAAKNIIDSILSRPNDFAGVEAKLERLLAEAKSRRDALAKQ